MDELGAPKKASYGPIRVCMYVYIYMQTHFLRLFPEKEKSSIASFRRKSIRNNCLFCRYLFVMLLFTTLLFFWFFYNKNKIFKLLIHTYFVLLSMVGSLRCIEPSTALSQWAKKQKRIASRHLGSDSDLIVVDNLSTTVSLQETGASPKQSNTLWVLLKQDIIFTLSVCLSGGEHIFVSVTPSPWIQNLSRRAPPWT